MIEEPTIGLHMADVKRVIDILHRLINPKSASVMLKIESSRNEKHPEP